MRARVRWGRSARGVVQHGRRWLERPAWAASGAVQVSQRETVAARAGVARQHLTGDADSTTRVRIGRRPGSRRLLGGVAEKGEILERPSRSAQALLERSLLRV